MAESRIKDENYYQIQGWMINRLGLKGVPLSVYAIVYGFSQDGESEYTGSLQYLCDLCGGVSKPTIINALKSLVNSGYLIRQEDAIKGVQFNRYKANLPLLKNLYYPDKDTLTEGVKNLNEGGKEILPNNKSNNNSLYNLYNKDNETASAKPARAPKHKKGEYGNVRLTEEEEAKLIDEYGEIVTVKAIAFLDEYIEEKGYKAKSHYLTIRRWVIDAVKERVPKKKVNEPTFGNSFDTDDFFEAALKRSFEKDSLLKTAANDESIRERANALKAELGG